MLREKNRFEKGAHWRLSPVGCVKAMWRGGGGGGVSEEMWGGGGGGEWRGMGDGGGAQLDLIKSNTQNVLFCPIE